MKPEFDREKFKAALHYLCRHADEDFGRVKLHKALYFADMLHFVDKGEPLTGVDYVKQQFGPTARHLKWGLDELVREGALRVSQERYFGLPKYVFRSLREPASNHLSDDDRTLLDEVLKFVADHSATAISELSHNEAWHAFETGEVIPYETAYWLVPTEVTDEDMIWAEAQMREHACAS
ncbi:Panacea domain-containing protein [Bosea sp. TWI1241]|uniref:Panacea domain-containing protein n=1 Tax=Bosea sp. TWI1241 TaxID=3148904 RepID=UPI0032082A43